MIKNFIFILKRFKTSSVLNILGLSVAFAVFIIIMMQANYDSSFDKSVKGSDKIYRVEILHGMEEKQAISNRPLAEIIFESSPHIVGGTYMMTFSGSQFIMVDNAGIWSGYTERMIPASPGFAKVFQPEMSEGNEKALEEPHSVLIPESMARKFFGKQSAVGKQIGKDKSLTIGGVYRDFPANASIDNAIYYPIGDENKTNWNNWNYAVFIRLDNPVSAKDIEANVMQHLPKDIADEWGKGGVHPGIQLTKLTDLHFTNDVKYDPTPKASRQKLAVLYAIAVAILVIAGINFINFSMALVPGRIRSINTQKILGASQTNLRWNMISEAMLMCFISFLLSLLLVFLASNISSISGLIDSNMNLLKFPLLIGFTACIALILGFLSGIYPAFYSTSFQPALVLKGSFGLTPQGRTLRNVLIGLQFVASLVLIIAASFMYLQNKFLFQMPLGYDRDEIIVSDMNDNTRKQRDVLINELKSYPGIEDVSIAQSLIGSSDQYMGWGRKYLDQQIQFQCFPVDPNFLQMMNIPVSEGENFKEDDKDTKFGKYIFNETAHKQYNLKLNTEIDSAEITGFIPDVHFSTFHTATVPMAFYLIPPQWGNWWMNVAYIKVKAGSNMYEAMNHIKKTFTKIDSEYPFNIRFYDEVLQKAYQKDQRMTSQITVFGAISIFISLIGVFGLILFETRFRRREIAIRKVHGSSIEEVIRLFSKTYIFIWALCFIIACPLAYFFVNKWLAGFAYKTPMYAWVFLAGGAIVLIITMVTVAVQSYRAATLNPTKALNSE